MAVTARLSLGGDHAPSLGHERIRLLEALGREGSISGAARAVGITYKAAWDAIDAMNNLFGRPLVTAQAGGRKGGGAELTPAGLRVVAAFHRLEGELARTLKEMEPELAGTGIAGGQLVWGFLTRTSARNALRGTISALRNDGVNAEVTLALTPEIALTSVITHDSAERLGLFPGREVIALIKASLVILAAPDDARRTSASNRLEGLVSRREDGPVNSEITLDIADGKTVTAVITSRSADNLGLRIGEPAAALIDAAHILLAVD